jgi:5'-phosphate synthase pdxT subunit
MTIGVLAVQGAFIEHINMLKNLNVEAIEIRNKEDINKEIDGFIFPGGESTTMGKLLHDLELFEPIKKRIREGLPVFGTCAGMILLAKKIDKNQTIHLGSMDVCVVRNAFGRQLGSFRTISAFGKETHIEMPFIRAPYIKSVGKEVQILSVVDHKIVAARQGNQLVTAFHPELTSNISVHRYFLNMIDSKIR